MPQDIMTQSRRDQEPIALIWSGKYRLWTPLRKFVDEGQANMKEEEARKSDDTLLTGAVYETASDAVKAVQDYALSQNKSIKVQERSGMHRRITCTSDGCVFFV